jgi:hypothetical protein
VRLLYLCYFSKPAANRPIYRAIRRLRPKKIVEVEIGDAGRAMRIIETAQRAALRDDIHYVGMDLFEGRPAADGPGLTLKAAHQQLRETGARVQLVPGNPADTIVRLANSLGKVDILIVPASLESPAFARTWFFVPRILHDRSVVFVDDRSPDGQPMVRQIHRAEVDKLAGTGRRAA